ncbi:MAG: FAD-binding oxidoreductase [Armatimonadetes bacterium]|nr:FAD-binding oxidoreductase [Armatimonadota bacterium]
MVARPGCIEELAEIIRGSGPFGFQQMGLWSLPCEAYGICAMPQGAMGLCIDFGELNQMVDFSPADLIITVGTGTTLSKVNQLVGSAGLCVPYCADYIGGDDLTLGELIGLNLPHPLERQFGSWRDWILATKQVLADGTICKSGAKVVKSVAGYDIHKLFVGARGSFAAVAEVTLRLYPKQEPRPEARNSANIIHRVLPSDFDAMANSYRNAVFFDEATATIYANVPAFFEPLRFERDFVIRSGVGRMNFQLGQVNFLSRAKATLDPNNKLNPGALIP